MYSPGSSEMVMNGGIRELLDYKSEVSKIFMLLNTTTNLKSRDANMAPNAGLIAPFISCAENKCQVIDRLCRGAVMRIGRSEWLIIFKCKVVERGHQGILDSLVYYGCGGK